MSKEKDLEEQVQALKKEIKGLHKVIKELVEVLKENHVKLHSSKEG